MCGILFSSFLTDDLDLYTLEGLRFLRHRGVYEPRYQVVNHMFFAHSLLPVQGYTPVIQPIIMDKNVLLFSGELWDHPGYKSDTLYLFDKLIQENNITVLIAELKGMFGFVFYKGDQDVVYFASDIFGEVPLYFNFDRTHLSVASEIKQLCALGIPINQIKPVLPGFLYSFDLKSKCLVSTQYHRWEFSNDHIELDAEYLTSLITKSVQIKYKTIDLQQSALLLSGGVDSYILAYELSKLGLKNTFTVVANEDALDFNSAQKTCDTFGLQFNPIFAKDLCPDSSIAVSETSNRSIIEEMCCHIILSNTLRDRGIRVVFAGCGADEIFIGYQHLLRYRSQDSRKRLQEEFVTNYHKMDLRSFNKVYMLNAIEIRNPFLSSDLMDYASKLDIDNLLIGRKREMKRALRLVYLPILGDMVNQPKRIARETMGVKQLLQQKYGDSPLIYKQRWKEIFGNPNLLFSLLINAKALY